MDAKRVLITGGTGMIGANLAPRLAADGHRVFLLKRRNSDLIRLRASLSQAQMVEGDLGDASSVQRVVEQTEPELVYHLASTPFNPPTTTAREHMQVICMGTLNLLDALVGRPHVRVICAGSAAEYGSGSQLHEDAPLLPGTALGAAKSAASIWAQTYARLHGLETVVLRLFTPYGPLEHCRRLIPHTILSALRLEDVRMSSGQQQRDFVYIDDVIQALLLAAARPVAPGSVFNICSGTGSPVRQVVELILKLMGNPVKALVGALPSRPDEIREICGDNSKARLRLGWEPRISLEDGLGKTIAWIRQDPEFASSLV